ncbi:MAG: DUF4062 domain-containing protein [Treponema sp.]|nr:DUF4062 domain-containing protein [Treponema sp.]
MLKKYFVYISSTRDDLKAERRELVRVVLEMGAVPVVMDTFDITHEGERRIICKAIEECDYFLNLTAYMGGEAVGKISALEFEYSCAVRAGLPVLALVIGENARWKDSKKEKEASARKALEAFKNKLEGHAHDTWNTPGDIRCKALALLSREMNLNPRRGWVPSTLAVEPQIANELCRVLQENDALRRHVKLEGIDLAKKVRDQVKHALKVLAGNRISLSFYYIDGENWENTQKFRYVRLFRLLAPELTIPKTGAEISHFLGNILNPDLTKTKIVRKDYPTPSNTIKKIMADFTLLRLVKCSGSGDNETWGMTEFGKETFAAYRLRQMERPLVKAKEAAQSKKGPAN